MILNVLVCAAIVVLGLGTIARMYLCVVRAYRQDRTAKRREARRQQMELAGKMAFRNLMESLHASQAEEMVLRAKLQEFKEKWRGVL